MSTDHKSPKNNKLGPISRREFVKRAGASALGGALSLTTVESLFANDKPTAPPACQPKYELRNHLDSMTYAPLGRTRLMVSRLALGGNTCQSPVVRRAVAEGINLVHGSNEYGTMEAQAKTFANLWEKVWYALKQAPKEKDMNKCLDDCLKTLKRDHIDIILPVITASNSYDKYQKVKDELSKLFEKLHGDFEKCKKAGKVRFLGATVHNHPDGLLPLCHDVTQADIFDVILTMYQPVQQPALNKELARATKKNVGIIAMKTAQGVKKTDTAQALADALAHGTIQTVLRCVDSMAELDAYLNVLRPQPKPSKPDESQACADPTACAACGYCEICPQQLAIPEIMRCATYYHPRPTLKHLAAQTYRQIPAPATIPNCGDCTLCEQICPRRLPIRSTLRWARQHWT